MNPKMLDRILRCPTLPTLPAVAIRVLELTRDPNLALDTLAAAIEHDQGLAAKILRTANSSFYGLRRPCATIQQSVVMLGLSAVKSLALSFSLVTALDGAGGFDYAAHWRRAIYAAVGARRVARAAGLPQEDEAFLGALLQDIGVVALHRALGGEYLDIMREAGCHRDLSEHEVAALDTHHAEIGAILAQRWRLPDDLVMAIRYHERPTAAPPEHADLVRCVGLGNAAHNVLTDASPGGALDRFRTWAREWFELTDVDALIAEIGAAAAEVAPLFRADTGPYPDAEAVLAAAREQAAALQREAAASMRDLVSDGDECDPITGVLRREVLWRRAEEAFDAARGTGRSVAVVEVAIDGFAGLAPAARDAVLVEVGRLVGAHFPPGTLIGRAGAGGFSVLAVGLDPVGAARAGSEIRTKVAGQSVGWRVPGLNGPLTASVGTAATGTGDGRYTRVQQLFTAARRAMEAASAEGGNAVKAFVPRAAA